MNQFDNIAIFMLKKLRFLSEKVKPKDIALGIFNSIELSKMITHYDFLSNTKPKADIMLKIWTHILDLIFDLDSLSRPLSNLEKNTEFFYASPKSFSSISEAEESSEKSSLKSSIKSRKSSEKSEKFREKAEKLEKMASYENDENDENDENIKNIEKPNNNLPSFDNLMNKIEANSNLLPEKSPKVYSKEILPNTVEPFLEETEDKKIMTSPSAKAFIQNKLKRREVIQGKVIKEYSLNSLDRHSLLSDIDNNDELRSMNESEGGNLGNLGVISTENRIKRQETLMKTKSSILEQNFRNLEENEQKTDIFSKIIEILCVGMRENVRKSEIKELLDMKDELIFFNEEMFEDAEGEENNEDQEEILVLLTKKNKEVFNKIIEKLKKFFQKYPESCILLNAFSANLNKVLAHIFRILEVLQASSLNFILISPIESNEYLLKFCCEMLHYQYHSVSSLNISEFKALLINVLEFLLSRNQKCLCYLHVENLAENEEILHILKNFMKFGNLNVIFPRKELKNLLNKYKNHVELEPYGFEQQLFILSNKLTNMLRFVLSASKEMLLNIPYHFPKILKVFLRQNENLIEINQFDLNLNLDFSLEKINKIRYLQLLEIDFFHNFNDFHGFSLIKNPDLQQFFLKYLEHEFQTYFEKKLDQFKKTEIIGKLMEIIKRKEDIFTDEIKELQEKTSILNRSHEKTLKEEQEIKQNIDRLTEEIEHNKKDLEDIEISLKNHENKCLESYESYKAKKIEILNSLKNIEFDKEFLENSFEKSEIFQKYSNIFFILFKKAMNVIGSPLKREYDSVKSQIFALENEENDVLTQSLGVKCLGSREKIIEIFQNFDFIEHFPKNQLDRLMNFLDNKENFMSFFENPEISLNFKENRGISLYMKEKPEILIDSNENKELSKENRGLSFQLKIKPAISININEKPVNMYEDKEISPKLFSENRKDSLKKQEIIENLPNLKSEFSIKIQENEDIPNNFNKDPSISKQNSLLLPQISLRKGSIKKPNKQKSLSPHRISTLARENDDKFKEISIDPHDDYKDLSPKSYDLKILKNETQKNIILLLQNEILYAKFDQKLNNEKNEIIANMKRGKLEIEEKLRSNEVNTYKLSKYPLLLSEIQQKRQLSEQILAKSLTNFEIIGGLISNSREIINIGLEEHFPYFSQEKSKEELIFALIIYVTFILKYPSFFRKLLIQKSEGFFLINKEMQLFDYPIFSILKDFPIESLEKKPYSFDYLNILSIFDILIDFDALSILVIDPNDFFYEFLLKIRKNLICEEICEDNNSENNIIEALSKGFVLIVRNFTRKLFEMIEIIINWKFQKVLTKMFKNNKKDDTYDESHEYGPFGDIEIFGRNIVVHKAFRLVLIQQNEDFLKIQNNSLNKLLIMFADIEDRNLWEQAVSLKFSHRFESVERKSSIDQLFQKQTMNSHFENNENLYQEFLTEFKKINTIQEISTIDKLKSCYLIIRLKFLEDFLKNQKKIGFSREIQEICREIKKNVQKNTLKRPVILMEVKDKQRFQSLIDFMHIVKLTNYSLLDIIGNGYGFSDGVYLEILEWSLDGLQENSIELNV